jgi:hypothetical protein
MSRDLSRRTVLKGLLGGALVSVGLPVLEVFTDSTGRAWADGSGFPRRFGMFYWGNGVIPERWVPQGQGREWTLSEQLAPLAGVKDDISVVSGLSCKVPNVHAHISGAAGLLTGAPLLSLGERNTFQAPTIDQVIAAGIGGETRFRSLEFGVVPGEAISFAGQDAPNPPETSPFALFERVFGAGFRLPGDDSAVDPRLGLRRSVLDAVRSDAASLRNRLGRNDRQRLDQHLEGIRGLELQLARLEEDPPDLEACAVAPEPLSEYPDIEGRPQLRARNRAMCDIIAYAVACDQTRVFTNAFTTGVSNALFPGAPAGHHQLTHDEPGEQPNVHAIVVQIIEELAYMYDRFRSIPEGDGTLLDHCAIVGLSEISYGRTHSLDDLPIVIGGSAGGALTKGIHYRSLGENASSFLLTLQRAMGMRVAEFGQEDAYVSESLTAIES